jgi:hypothetical protein
VATDLLEIVGDGIHGVSDVQGLAVIGSQASHRSRIR